MQTFLSAFIHIHIICKAKKTFIIIIDTHGYSYISLSLSQHTIAMRNKIVYVFIFAAMLLTGWTGAAQEKIIKGFSGGMMVHGGYLSGGDNPFKIEPSGATFGIGGVAKLHLSNHFRAGFEGYFSNMGIDEEMAVDGSFNKVFWTGILGDFFWTFGKFKPYVGTTVGGGMETAFYMTGDKHDWLPEASAVYNKMPFLAVDPFVGLEYAAGEALNLTIKADWLLGFNSDGLNRPMGPRVYFGFIFTH